MPRPDQVAVRRTAFTSAGGRVKTGSNGKAFKRWRPTSATREEHCRRQTQPPIGSKRVLGALQHAGHRDAVRSAGTFPAVQMTSPDAANSTRSPTCKAR
jgi:hypothetical protein